VTWLRGAALVAASLTYTAFVLAAAGKFGANYEEVVPYVLTRLDIRDPNVPAPSDLTAPGFVVSPFLPRLAFAPSDRLLLPILNQLYMTDHLSYGGVVLAATGLDRLWAARLWHAASGIIVLWLLYDVAILLGLGFGPALIATAIAATSLQVTSMFMWARFDESLASSGSVAVLWACLRYSREPRRRWIWIAMLAAAVAVSGKVTALWILGALGLAAVLAGWQPPPLRELRTPALTASLLFVPMIAFGISGSGTSMEVGRRLAFLGDLFTTDAVPGAAVNLVDYLGNWSGILGAIIRGMPARPPNVLGLLIAASVLLWLAVRVAEAGSTPRRQRLESAMLVVVGVIFALVALFYREHRDYQFSLLVPLHAIAIAACFAWAARRVLGRYVPVWLGAVLLTALAIASNLWDQYCLHADLAEARNAMVDLDAQRASAAWLREHGVDRPVVVTFYAVGTYELFTDAAVRPVYGFPWMRYPNDRAHPPDLVAGWRTLLAAAGREPAYAVVAVGENPIEARHFDEPAIRAALFQVARAERVAVFSSRNGVPELEVWRVAGTDAPIVDGR
jgi:hypothetical protein